MADLRLSLGGPCQGPLDFIKAAPETVLPAIPVLVYIICSKWRARRTCSLASHTLRREEGRDQTLPLPAKGVACETRECDAALIL